MLNLDLELGDRTDAYLVLQLDIYITSKQPKNWRVFLFLPSLAWGIVLKLGIRSGLAWYSK